MTYTLFQASLDLSRIVQKTIESTMTSAGTTYLIDTNLLTAYPVDHFNSGTVWIKSGSYANTSKVITDYDDTLHKATWSGALPGTPGNDQYAIAFPRVPRYKLWEALNQAQQELVETVAEDSTLTTVVDQAEYTLPTGKGNVMRVWVAQNTAAPWNWQRHYHWVERFETGKLRFDEGFYPANNQAGYTIRYEYATAPADMNGDASEVQAPLNRGGYRFLLLWTAAAIALRDRHKIVEGNDPTLTNQMNEAIIKAEAFSKKYPIPALIRDPHLGRY